MGAICRLSLQTLFARLFMAGFFWVVIFDSGAKGLA
jgi:hypothetical protein